MLVNSAAVGIPTAHSSSDNTKDKQSADESKKQLQSDEKQIKFDMTPPETLVKSGGPQNPSIQQSLQEQQQKQEELYVQRLQSDTDRLQSDEFDACIDQTRPSLVIDIAVLKKPFLMQRREEFI